MNSTFYRDDFWGAWMATDYYSSQFQLEFGPTTVKFDLVPENLIIKWFLASSATSISYSYACNYTVFVQALFLSSMSCRAAPRAVTEGVYGRLGALSHACYFFGAAILCLSVIVHYYWFPATKPIVAATECHGEIPDIEARMCDIDLSRPLACCSFNFALAAVTIFDNSGQIICIPGTLIEHVDDISVEQFTSCPLLESSEQVRLRKSAYDSPHKIPSGSSEGSHLVDIDIEY